MSHKNKGTSKIQDIGFGMAMGGMLSILIMLPIFGNDKEVLCVFPVVVFGMLLLGNDKPYKKETDEQRKHKEHT